MVAGHKGQPDEVKKRGREGRRRRLKGKRGRGTAENDKPPIFGMVQRGGQMVIQMLDNVKQKTIKPIIETMIAKETLIHVHK
ncbi:MAG: transposase [Candidatus Promineifilaceae bacterium]